VAVELALMRICMTGSALASKALEGPGLRGVALLASQVRVSLVKPEARFFVLKRDI
jgi:hypothetical protein